MASTGCNYLVMVIIISIVTNEFQTCTSSRNKYKKITDIFFLLVFIADFIILLSYYIAQHIKIAYYVHGKSLFNLK